MEAVKVAKRSFERRIEPRLLPPVLDDRPFYDEELDLGQSVAHQHMIWDIGGILQVLGRELGLPTLIDNSVWFLEPADDVQKVLFPDLIVLEPGTDIRRATAEDALLAVEVVTTTERRKEVKDTTLQRARCEYNGVPELYLFFPEIDDARALTHLRFGEDDRYEEVAVAPGASVASETLPGLVFRVLPKSDWEPGRKVEVYWEGEIRLPLDQERARAEMERARAESERVRADAAELRADQARAEAEAARARAEAMAERLRALGLEIPEE